MLRFLAILFAFVLVVPVIRFVLGLLGRAFTNFALGNRAAGPGQAKPRVPAGGTLRKDPVCGTFVSEDVAILLSSGGHMHYFCSNECRDKFQKQA
jgi:YHS domain-containing protein